MGLAPKDMVRPYCLCKQWARATIFGISGGQIEANAFNVPYFLSRPLLWRLRTALALRPMQGIDDHEDREPYKSRKVSSLTAAGYHDEEKPLRRPKQYTLESFTSLYSCLQISGLWQAPGSHWVCPPMPFADTQDQAAAAALMGQSGGAGGICNASGRMDDWDGWMDAGTGGCNSRSLLWLLPASFVVRSSMGRKRRQIG